MLTFFIYDTAYCKADDDDPKDAVLYFFPTEVYLKKKNPSFLILKYSIISQEKQSVFITHIIMIYSLL